LNPLSPSSLSLSRNVKKRKEKKKDNLSSKYVYMNQRAYMSAKMAIFRSLNQVWMKEFSNFICDIVLAKQEFSF
jgi:hypothetical protein